MIFYTGTHIPAWLWSHGEFPLFVSDNTLRRYKCLRPAQPARWAVDSGGYTELTRNGVWTVSPIEYAQRVRRYAEEIGNLDWAAPQDWMCEDVVLQKTGLSVWEHQRRTTDSVLRLRDLLGSDIVVPVLQGQSEADYLRHVDHYTNLGVSLHKTTVGIGSVCRRQNVTPVLNLIRSLAGQGLRIHAFGFKKTGLTRVGDVLHSSDSLAWSYTARRLKAKAQGCLGKHKNCANCFLYAAEWTKELRSSVGAIQ